MRTSGILRTKAWCALRRLGQLRTGSGLRCGRVADVNAGPNYWAGLASSPVVATTMATVPRAAAAMRVTTRAVAIPPTSSVEAAVTANDAVLPPTTLAIALVPTILPAVSTISIT